MPALVLFDDYTREEVHDLFAPQAPFTPQRGTWGLQGIITLPDRPGDFLFFVMFGQRQGEHVFDEGITEEGVLSWQSRPRQGFHHPQIQQFIHHDELTHTIYVFLRTTSGRPYTYLGRLKYLAHDTEREHPVYFQWRLLDWPPPPAVMQRMDLGLQKLPQTPSSWLERETTTAGSSVQLMIDNFLPSPLRERSGTTTGTFRTQKVRDYAEVDARNRALGRAGECLVLAYEQHMLTQQGRPDLAQRIRHVAKLEGDGAGYDVLSFNKDGSVKYIEVKTTRGPAETAFFMSAHELAFAQQHAERYYLYRIYGYNAEAHLGRCYIIIGLPEGRFDMTPTQYRLRPR